MYCRPPAWVAPPCQAPRARRGGLPHAARALPRSRARASTRPTTCASATSAAPGRSAAPSTARACARAPPARRARRRHRHRRRAPGCGCAAGELSGIEAFSQRPLYARGDLDLRRRLRGPLAPARRPPAAAAHPRRAPARPPRLDADDGRGPRRPAASTASARTKASFFDTAAALSRDGYRVHALDLPGFGSLVASRRPAPYTRALVRRDRARRDGRARHRPRAPRRQLDGRPRRARGRRCARPSASARSALLCPAVAFVKRGYPPDRPARCAPSSACLPHRFAPRAWSPRQFWQHVLRPRRASTPTSPTSSSTSSSASTARAGARFAFLARGAQHLPRQARSAARLLPAPGRTSSRRRCSSGASHDKLIPRRLQAPRRPSGCPRAEQIVLEGCGHVPQVERPEQTNGLHPALPRPRRRARRALRAGASPTPRNIQPS